MSHKILLVEDEPSIRNVVDKYLTQAGLEVVSVPDGFEAIRVFDTSFDLVCLDIMMPNIDGWEVAETIREKSQVPIIITTALSSDEDQLKGYSYQIDDYITKPFNPKILVEKVKILLKRTENSSIVEEKQDNTVEKCIFKKGPIEVDKTKGIVKIDNKIQYVSKTEFDLLCFFLNNYGEICSRETIFETVWASDSITDTRIIDAYIKKLRKLLGKYSSSIQTVFGVGYRFIIE